LVELRWTLKGKHLTQSSRHCTTLNNPTFGEYQVHIICYMGQMRDTII